MGVFMSTFDSTIVANNEEAPENNEEAPENNEEAPENNEEENSPPATPPPSSTTSPPCPNAPNPTRTRYRNSISPPSSPLASLSCPNPIRTRRRISISSSPTPRPFIPPPPAISVWTGSFVRQNAQNPIPSPPPSPAVPPHPSRELEHANVEYPAFEKAQSYERFLRNSLHKITDDCDVPFYPGETDIDRELQEFIDNPVDLSKCDPWDPQIRLEDDVRRVLKFVSGDWSYNSIDPDSLTRVETMNQFLEQLIIKTLQRKENERARDWEENPEIIDEESLKIYIEDEKNLQKM